MVKKLDAIKIYEIAVSRNTGWLDITKVTWIFFNFFKEPEPLYFHRKTKADFFVYA